MFDDSSVNHFLSSLTVTKPIPIEKTQHIVQPTNQNIPNTTYSNQTVLQKPSKVNDSFVDEENINNVELEFDIKEMKEQIKELTEECLMYKERQKVYDSMKEEVETLRKQLSHVLDQNSLLYAKLNKYKEKPKPEDGLINKLIEIEHPLNTQC